MQISMYDLIYAMSGEYIDGQYLGYIDCTYSNNAQKIISQNLPYLLFPTRQIALYICL